MKKIIVIATLLTVIVGLSEEREFSMDILQQRYSAELDGTSDITLSSKVVPPDAEKPHGELRLVKRGEARVIQTLLFTRFPSRFLKKIKEKEAIAWPLEAMSGKDESSLYIKGVELAVEYAVKQYPFRENKDDNRKKLLIELVHSPRHSFAAFFTLETDETGDTRAITKRQVFSIIPLSRDYVRRQQTLLLEDAFKLDRKQIESDLGYTIPQDSDEIKAAIEAALRAADEQPEE